MDTLTVGPGDQFATITDAVAAAQTGDTIDVQAGTYTNDFPGLVDESITLQGVGGMVNLVATEDIPNEKGILDVGAAGVTVTINDFAISGGVVSDADGGNGAGIRYEGGNLVLNDDYMFDNQEGLLAEADPSGSITINSTEFADNGNSDPSSPGYGYTHNLYVNEVGTLTIDNSYFTGANIGHEIKSRALNTIIENSSIQDGPTGTASYDIDLPNGGNALIENNVIEKGPDASNPAIVSYGEEGGVYASSSLTITGNTILNDYSNPGEVTAVVNDTGVTASITDNQFYGLTSGQLADGSADVSGSVFLTSEPTLDTSSPWTACFVAGTRILTERGEVPVESLTAGERVLTAGGAARPVRWLGHSTRARMFADPIRELPIRIKASALGDNVPGRDLLLSPGHAMLIDGILVQCGALVNGTSVVRETAMPAVFSYYHVELDSHELLLAEGAPAESFLCGAEDMNFDNFADRPAGTEHVEEMGYPRVKAARQLPRAFHQRLAARAAAIAPQLTAA
jgi:Hint domain